jgi:hypothetical protein
LHCGCAIVREVDQEERTQIGRCKAGCLLIADQDVVASLKLIAEGWIATSLKLQEARAMLFLPSGDIGIGCRIEALALACHA